MDMISEVIIIRKERDYRDFDKERDSLFHYAIDPVTYTNNGISRKTAKSIEKFLK